MNKLIYRTLVALEQSWLFRCIPDKLYIDINYFYRRKKFINWKNPTTYNEKVNFLKLYERKEEFIPLSDKQASKEWVSQKIGEKYVFPTIGIWNSFDEVDFDALPEKFVLKCTHDSGGLIFCEDKSKLDMKELRDFFGWHMKRNYYWHGRQWAYKGVKPRIIAEPLMVDESGTQLKDYKIFCFDGVPKMIQVDYDRHTDHHRNLYTPDWEFIPASVNYPCDPNHQIPKPAVLEEMLQLAGILSEGIRHVRVDFYIINDRIYFGETTFYPANGCASYDPESFGVEMGSWLRLG